LEAGLSEPAVIPRWCPPSEGTHPAAAFTLLLQAGSHCMDEGGKYFIPVSISAA